MKPPKLEYVPAESVEQAASVKASYEGDASILAGGQSLIPMLNFRLATPSALIDLGRVPGLSSVRVEDGLVRVGAMTRHRELERDEQAAAACPLLAQALAHVAHPAIRNRGTLGGTMAHADSAAEMPAVLLALDGHVRVCGIAGGRTISAQELFVFHMTTSLELDEVLVEVAFPALSATAGTSFQEISRRHGDYALAGVCAVAELDAGGALADVRLACIGIGSTPLRASAAEHLLRGASPTEDAFAAAAEAAAACVDAVDEEQATVSYRRRLVQVLTVRALREACARSRARREDG